MKAALRNLILSVVATLPISSHAQENVDQYNARITELERKVNELENVIATLNSDGSINKPAASLDARFFNDGQMGGVFPSGTSSICQAGEIVIGIETFHTSHRECLGCVVAVRPICKNIVQTD